MSSVIKPVGPEEPQVYWKRRALVAGAVVLVLFILWMIFKPKGDPPPAEAANTAAASPSASPSAEPSRSGSNPSAFASASSSPSPTSTNACADADVGMAVTTSQETYQVGEDPAITLTISNDGETSCERDVGSLANAIEVSSGGVRVWSSDDCSTDQAADVVNLEPGQRATVTIVWPRTASEPGCKGEQAEAEVGAYDAIGSNGKVTSKKTSFSLG